ncbi:hypothetical protein [Actinoplanes sp. NPDC051494]|uniref:hypothetical protein n=1 Tax=Actinoplanes sp. NPDC051494 TaxID=3363907 RepID=UPI00378E6EDB
MRRALIAATLGGLLLSGTACSSGDADTAADTPRIVVPTSAAATTSPAPNYAANSKKVCGNVEKIYNDGIEDFGAQIGRMIAYKESKADDSAKDAATAEKAAGKELKDTAAGIRKETAAAEDPELKEAGAVSATKFSKSAADSALFDKIKTTKDFDKVLQAKTADWLNPVAGYCASRS